MKRFAVFAIVCSFVGVYGAFNLGTFRQLISYQGPDDPTLEVLSVGSGTITIRVPVFNGLEMSFQSLKTIVPALISYDLQFDLQWPEKVYKDEAFVLRAVASRTLNPDQAIRQNLSSLRPGPDPLEAVLVSLSIAGAVIEPEEPQKVGEDGRIAWSVKFEDQGIQSGVLRVESADDDVVVQTREVSSKVTVRDEFELSFEGVFALVSGALGFLIGLIGFLWKLRDRQKAKEVEMAEVEAKKRRLILPGK